jgi:hypothetical protein
MAAAQPQRVDGAGRHADHRGGRRPIPRGHPRRVLARRTVVEPRVVRRGPDPGERAADGRAGVAVGSGHRGHAGRPGRSSHVVDVAARGRRVRHRPRPARPLGPSRAAVPDAA